MKILPALLSGLLIATTLQAAPKKVLVVTTTTGFRHSSIPTAEKVLAELAQQSRERFDAERIQVTPGRSLTVSHRAQGFEIELLQQPPGRPANLKKDATDAEKAAFKTADAAWQVQLKAALQKLSPESLKQYDAVVFMSTTGDLPIPDPAGFLSWIKAGHAFIGIHAASDTFHGWPEFIAMLGGEFVHHGPQVGVECLNQDPQHPANAALGKTWTLRREEIYQFKNYNAAKVHDLLILDQHPENRSPGHFPVSWCKKFGQGNVFYTSLGHRDDVLSPDASLPDRQNPAAVGTTFQAHVLGGIEWALGLKQYAPDTPIP